LIRKHGYSAISMRMIASETGIAVGTLYNYYSDKEELTTTVVYLSWKETLKNLQRIIVQEGAPREKLHLFLEQLYEEISQRRGIGSELMKHDLYKDEKFLEIQVTYTNIFRSLLKELEKAEGKLFEEADAIRIQKHFMLITINLVNEFIEEDGENVRYLKEIADKLI
jgi:AcrR family transcriptional regulator